ncbi:hypothetical protein LCGC14_2047070, partial [marine sediment metagenome]
ADITFDTSEYDTAAIFNPGSPTLLTVPAGYDLVRLSHNLRATAGSGQLVISRLRKNGGGFLGGTSIASPASGSAVIEHNGATPPVVVVPGDTFGINVYNGTASTRVIGGDVNITWFAMELLSAI